MSSDYHAAEQYVQPILVVDDDDPLRELMRRILVGEGYPVREARDGAAALAQLRDGGIRPELILLDWRPRMA